MTQTELPEVTVSCRTEYLRPSRLIAMRATWICTIVSLIALVALNVAGVSPTIIAACAGGGLVLALACGAIARLGHRGAVLITVDDSTLYLGDERHQIVSYPLTAVREVTVGAQTPSASTGARRSGDPTDLTVAGARILTITVSPDGIARTDDPGSVAGETLRWRVAVVDDDPAAEEVIARLRRHAPAVAASASEHPAPEERSAPGASIVDAGSDEAAERLWEDATRRHDVILGSYGAYELQPDLLLRYPGVTDVGLPAVQEFHRALDEAMAVRTDAYPRDRQRADSYLQAVNTLGGAWRTCETQGRASGTDYLAASARDELATALDLFRRAQQSENPAEQVDYYSRVHRIVAELAERGTLHPPQPAVDELRAAGDRQK